VYGVIPLFGWPVVDLNVLMLLYVALIVTMIPFTIFIVSLLKDHLAAFETLMFLSAPVFLMSGFTWPADQMPTVLTHIAAIMPITPALQAQRIVMLKSSSLADIAPYLLWMGIQFAAWTAACLAWLNRPAVLQRPAVLHRRMVFRRPAIAGRIASMLRPAPSPRKEVSE
jgi:ABC-2 type transport system permease protein